MKKASKAKSRRITVDDVFRADDRWIRLMANRNYFSDFMRVILMNKKISGLVCYQGNVFFGEDVDVRPLIDSETHDIITLQADSMPRAKGQKIYKTIYDYLLDHKPTPDCFNIYFIGDIHDAHGSDFDVHWNCFIVGTFKGTVRLSWYDPSMSRKDREGYNFDEEKKYATLEALGKIVGKFEARNEVAIYAAQRICNPDYACVDSFCQTWVMMFAASIVEDKVDEFLKLPYDLYGNLILKTWLYCLIKNNSELTEWLKELQTKQLKPFEYCRMIPKEKDADYAKVAALVKVDSIKTKAGQTCFDAIIEKFPISNANKIIDLTFDELLQYFDRNNVRLSPETINAIVRYRVSGTLLINLVNSDRMHLLGINDIDKATLVKFVTER